MASKYIVNGPCKVYYGSGDGILLGSYQRGVTISVNTGVNPVTSDVGGTTPLVGIFVGKTGVVEVPLQFIDDVTGAGMQTEIWNAIGKFLNICLDGTRNPIGTLAMDYAKKLKIVERVGTDIWEAPYAIPVEPAEVQLDSTKEVVFPMRFLLLPVPLTDGVNPGKLFTTLPSYMSELI